MTENDTQRFILEHFLQHVSQGKSPATTARYQRVHDRLCVFINYVDVAPHLGTDLGALLESERQFKREGSFFRVFAGTELAICLAEFVDAAWLLPGRADAHAQVTYASRLLTWLRREGMIDRSAGCALFDTDYAIKRARTAGGVRGDRSKQSDDSWPVSAEEWFGE